MLVPKLAGVRIGEMELTLARLAVLGRAGFGLNGAIMHLADAETKVACCLDRAFAKLSSSPASSTYC